MKITKSNNVLVEETTRCNGMLVQGGICGRVTSYPLAGVIKATGLTREQIADAEPTDNAPAYGAGVTISEACSIEMDGRIVRKGTIIS
jgi:hypothetical protein